MSDIYTIWQMIKPGIDIALTQSQIEPLIEEQLSLASRCRLPISPGYDPVLHQSFKDVCNGLDYLKKQLLDTVKVRGN